MANRTETSIGIDMDFKHEQTFHVWVEIMKHAMEACKKAEKQVKKGQHLELASIDIDIIYITYIVRKDECFGINWGHI